MGRGILIGQRPSFCQFARGVDFSGDHIYHSSRACLSTQSAVDHGLALAQPRALHRSSAGKHHRHMGIGFTHRLKQPDLVVPQFHRYAVYTLALGQLIQAQKQQNHIRPSGQFHGCGQLQRILPAMAEEPRLITYYLQAAGLQAVQGVIYTNRVHIAGARALVARFFCKVADNCHSGPLGQGQQLCVIFQQHNSCLRRLADKCMMGRLVKVVRGIVRYANLVQSPKVLLYQ